MYSNSVAPLRNSTSLEPAIRRLGEEYSGQRHSEAFSVMAAHAKRRGGDKAARSSRVKEVSSGHRPPTPTEGAFIKP
jgi:hypothetical protein